MRTCKYPDKDCGDRYLSARNNHTTPICRLDEWKQKKGTCPYNPEIRSVTYKVRTAIKDKNQTSLSNTKNTEGKKE